MVSGIVDAPTVVVVVDGKDVVGQLHSSATGFIEFMDVMGLSHRKLVAVFFRKLCHLFVEHEHDVHSDAEVGCGEETLLLGQTTRLDFLEMRLPGSGAYHDR